MVQEGLSQGIEGSEKEEKVLGLKIYSPRSVRKVSLKGFFAVYHQFEMTVRGTMVRCDVCTGVTAWKGASFDYHKYLR